MTEQKAIDTAYSDLLDVCYANDFRLPNKDDFESGWNSALEWARTQQEPCIWVSKNGFTTRKSVADEWIGLGLDVEEFYPCPAPALNTWEADKDYTLDYSIHSNPSASVWAEAFCKQFPNSGADEGLMTGWFANAMMAVHDHLKRQEPDVQELVSALKAIVLIHDPEKSDHYRVVEALAKWEGKK